MALFYILKRLFCFGTTPRSSWALLLALYSEITSGNDWGTYTWCWELNKENTLPTEISMCLRYFYF